MDKNSRELTEEICDIIDIDMRRCWHLLPKDDIFVCYNFLKSSFNYFDTLSKIREHYEKYEKQ